MRDRVDSGIVDKSPEGWCNSGMGSGMPLEPSEVGLRELWRTFSHKLCLLGSLFVPASTKRLQKEKWPRGPNRFQFATNVPQNLPGNLPRNVPGTISAF